MIVVGGVSLVILAFIIGPLRLRTIRRLNRLAPGSLAFTIANRRRFADSLSLAAVGTSMGERAATLTGEPAVTADAAGLTFWDNTPFDYVGAIGWDRISNIVVRDIQTPYRRWSASAIVVDVAVGGATIALPLLSPNGSDRMFASRRESEYLALQLESLRATA